MKKFYFTFTFILTSFFAHAQQVPFITTWDVSGNDQNISIPTSGGGYNYTIDFGDGTIQTNLTGNTSHTYSQPGIYTVSITGDFPRPYFAGTPKLASVEQWGDIQWQSMENAFMSCINLVINAIDAPDLSQVSSLKGMFGSTSSMNQSINHWDVSNIADMSWMFDSSSYNQPLDNWDVSNVTDMSYMFRWSLFNQPINNWNVSNVENMNQMFNGTNYNQPLGNWNVSTVSNMWGMFGGTSNFNQDINSWDVSSVTNMAYMFGGASAFDQPLNNWNVSNVTDMSYMFSYASSFNQPLNNWDVSSVTTMEGMFIIGGSSNNFSFNQSLDSWNVSNVINMSKMFYGASFFNQPINNWDVSNVTNMDYMFAGTSNSNSNHFNQPLNNWNVGNVTTMQGMFNNALEFNQPLGDWNVSNVTNMYKMFSETIAFNHPLGTWDVSAVTNMSSMFEKAEAFNQPIGNWNVSNVINFSAMFKNTNVFNQDLSNWNFNTGSNLSSFLTNSYLDIVNYDLLLAQFDNLGLQNTTLGAEGLLYCNNTVRQNLINLNWNIIGDAHLVNCNQTIPSGAFVTRWEVTSDDLEIEIPTYGTGYNYSVDFGDGSQQNNVTGNTVHTYSAPGVYMVSISGNFPRIHFPNSNDAEKIRSVEQWGNIQWSSMEGAFSDCFNLKVNALDAPDLSQVTNMSFMFSGAETFNQPINHWDVSNVTNMEYLFRNATSFNQPLNNWNVSNVTSMLRMFSQASNFNSSIESWDVSSVTNMQNMFFRAHDFNQLINNWDVSNVTDMSFMFSNASSFNQPLNNWDVSSVSTMEDMFGKGLGSTETIFNQPINNWDVSNVTNMKSMFNGAKYFNQPLDSWNVSNVTQMSGMFSGAKEFNQPLEVWDVSSVTSFASMFSYCIDFNQPLENWDVSSATEMTTMFAYTTTFDQPLNNWNVSNVTNMNFMFRSANSFNQPLDNWNVSNVLEMRSMFSQTESFNQPISNWNTSNVTLMIGMFEGAVLFNQNLDNWDVSNVISISRMFNEAGAFNQDLSNWDFNPLVEFLESPGSPGFISNSGMNMDNYENLLAHFAFLGLQDKTFKATGMKYCNNSARNVLVNNLGWSIYQDDLASDCNSLTGNILFDENNNNCDANDTQVNGIMISATDGVNSSTAFSSNGSYNMGMLGNDFTVTLINVPAYFTANPESSTVTFNPSDEEVQMDFCLTANQSIEDLDIVLLPLTEARPGSEAEYQLVVSNVGTESINNITASITFDETMQTFVNATPAPSSSTSSTLSFSIAGLQPFETQTLDLTMLTFEPPTVNGDDILNFTATAGPNTNDNTPENNTYVLDQVVVNSYDPNDKRVLQGEEIYMEQTDEYLDYIIRFQNTGTASAINVRLLDTLHPKLNWNTIQPISASHDYQIQITNGNKVEFIFDNINLPYEADNEPESHGFVAYRIKLNDDVQIGDIVSGDAEIYFDFNAPIITNNATTEIVQNMGINDNDYLAKNVTLYPNPTKDNFNVKAIGGILIEEIILYNLQGIEVRRVAEPNQNIDISKLASGMYFVKIKTNQGNANRQLIKN